MLKKYKETMFTYRYSHLRTILFIIYLILMIILIICTLVPTISKKIGNQANWITIWITAISGLVLLFYECLRYSLKMSKLKLDIKIYTEPKEFSGPQYDHFSDKFNDIISNRRYIVDALNENKEKFDFNMEKVVDHIDARISIPSKKEKYIKTLKIVEIFNNSRIYSIAIKSSRIHFYTKLIPKQRIWIISYDIVKLKLIKIRKGAIREVVIHE